MADRTGNQNRYWKLVSLSLTGYLIGFGLGTWSGYSKGTTKNRPVKVYARDLNGDGYQDVVTRSQTETLVFLGQKDGTYKRIEDALEEQKAQVDELRKSIEAKVQDLK